MRWYLALLPIGAAGLLPSALLFARLHSAGVLYTRPLALLLLALAAWLTAALTPLPYGTGLLAGLLAALLAWSVTLAVRRPELARRVWANRRLLLGGELLFVALFALLLVVRAQAPAALGTEKPMDLMLLTAVHRTDSFPPPDPWFAGERISYYHLGHTMVDGVGRLGGTGPARSFNLGTALAGALAGTAVFALAADLVALSPRHTRRARRLAGGVAVAGLLLVAPLEGLAELAAANGLGGATQWGRLGVEGLPGPAEATAGVPDQFWWWWRATRVLPGTITEFPAFSLILGDLHAHLLALPVAIVALALAAVAIEGRTPLDGRRWLRQPEALLLAGAVFAGLAMTNSWDVLPYGLVWLGAVVAAGATTGWRGRGALGGALRHLLPPTLVALLLSALFLRSLDGPDVGLALVTGAGSDPTRLLLVWTPLALPLLAAAVWWAQRRRRSFDQRPEGACSHTATERPEGAQARTSLSARARPAIIAAMLPAAAVAGWAVAVVLSGQPDALLTRGTGWLVLLTLVAAIGLAGAATGEALRGGQGRLDGRQAREPDRARAAWLGLVVLALVLVLATELVRIDDVFDNRMNTVFKFWYAAWVLLAVAGGVAIGDAFGRARAVSAPPVVLMAVLAALAMLYLASMLYAPAAVVSRGREGQERGLDALAYLDVRDPGRAQAVRWVAANLGDGDVLLEAAGPSYSESGLTSAFTAVPTLLGWPGHELQWRGEGAGIVARAAVVDRIFEGGASPATAAIAQAHGVTHLYLGEAERARYGPGLLARFAGWETVFEAPGRRRAGTTGGAAEAAEDRAVRIVRAPPAADTDAR